MKPCRVVTMTRLFMSVAIMAVLLAPTELVAARRTTAPKFVTLILGAYCGPFIDAGSRYPARLLVAVSQLGEEGRQALLWLARQGEAERICGLHYLSALGDPRALPFLRKRLSSRSISVDELVNIIADLKAFRDPRSLPRILDLAKSNDAGISIAAIEYLGFIDREDVRQYLRSLLVTGTEDKLVAVVDAVSRQQDQRAIAELEQVAAKFDSLKSEVGIALGRMLDAPAESVAALIRRLADRDARLWAATRIIEELSEMEKTLPAASQSKIADRKAFFEQLRSRL